MDKTLFQDCEMKGRAQKRPSTDGTRLGADIAELMGTTDEEEITEMGLQDIRRSFSESLTGMGEEQADWEEGGDEE